MTDADTDRMAEIEAQIERLRARLTDLEVALIHMRGSIAGTAPDEPATITHDYPPSAPPHNE